ncbi:MAG: chemotaxis protein CheB [Acetobacteraceae bacterium]
MPNRHPHSVKAARRRSSRRAVPLDDPPRSTDKFAVVAVGASAGGLDACRKLVSALPAADDMAFILVQHLDPTHESMMVDLLAGHTSGLVIAPDPDEAGYDGMPRSAIMTGAVDLVLPVAKIAEALAKSSRRTTLTRTRSGLHPKSSIHDWLPEILGLLRTKAAHDFTLYKEGTLERRIERRMAVAAIEAGDMDRYLELLRSDAAELDLLAKDMLINVTSFFRDLEVFDHLEDKIIPELVRNHAQDRPLRIWIAGCSMVRE